MMDSSDEVLRDEPLRSTTDHLAVVPPDEHERKERCGAVGLSALLFCLYWSRGLTEHVAATDGGPQPIVSHGRDGEHRQAGSSVGRDVAKVVDDVDWLEKDTSTQ
jgi:hypothetical protein